MINGSFSSVSLKRISIFLFFMIWSTLFLWIYNIPAHAWHFINTGKSKCIVIRHSADYASLQLQFMLNANFHWSILSRPFLTASGITATYGISHCGSACWISFNLMVSISWFASSYVLKQNEKRKTLNLPPSCQIFGSFNGFAKPKC